MGTEAEEENSEAGNDKNRGNLNARAKGSWRVWGSSEVLIGHAIPLNSMFWG
jgi:hypothetical protein